jgi:predicted NACHT family NTPase
VSKAPPHHPRATTIAARFVSETLRKAVADEQASRAIPASLLEKRRARAETRLLEALEARGRKALPAVLREEVTALVTGWAREGFSDGFDPVEQFETRCFQEGELEQALRSGDATQVFAAEEKKHRAAIVEEYGSIEIRGLQMSERVYQKLDIVYVPLQIEDETQKREVIRAGEGIEISTMPRLTVPELLAKHERAIIVGAPGSGKTTIVAYLAGMAAADRLHGSVGWDASPVPFVVAMRSFRGTRLDEETIATAACRTSAAFVRRVLEEHRGLILVDGLDEAPGGAEEALSALRAFIKAYPGNRILVTTRPAGPLGSERVGAPGFVTTSLLPMTREEVYLFIDRWCEAAEVSIQKDRGRAVEEAKKAAGDLKSRVETSRPVERLAQTPLVCSVLCIVHRFLGQRVPERRAALYEACTNALLYEWDRVKFPDGSAIGQLDAQDKRSLLCNVARKMHEKRVAEISSSDLIIPGKPPALPGRLPKFDVSGSRFRPPYSVSCER